ncbi:MAG: hypothetical protein IKA32_04780 [Lentisphaeria bacterium]|nr:hypothetical protein [Lentisphaeria bacterium]
MGKVLWLILWGALLIICAPGCNSTGKAVTQSASGKNLNLDGFLMMGKIETANPETGMPQGEMITGRVAYKSRRVSVPADQKVPTTGNFKATKTKSLFGTEELIIEYDFTAGSDADAKAALAELEKRSAAAAKAFAETDTKPDGGGGTSTAEK